MRNFERIKFDLQSVVFKQDTKSANSLLVCVRLLERLLCIKFLSCIEFAFYEQANAPNAFTRHAVHFFPLCFPQLARCANCSSLACSRSKAKVVKQQKQQQRFAPLHNFHVIVASDVVVVVVVVDDFDVYVQDW